MGGEQSVIQKDPGLITPVVLNEELLKTEISAGEGRSGTVGDFMAKCPIAKDLGELQIKALVEVHTVLGPTTENGTKRSESEIASNKHALKEQLKQKMADKKVRELLNIDQPTETSPNVKALVETQSVAEITESIHNAINEDIVRLNSIVNTDTKEIESPESTEVNTAHIKVKPEESYAKETSIIPALQSELNFITETKITEQSDLDVLIQKDTKDTIIATQNEPGVDLPFSQEEYINREESTLQEESTLTLVETQSIEDISENPHTEAMTVDLTEVSEAVDEPLDRSNDLLDILSAQIPTIENEAELELDVTESVLAVPESIILLPLTEKIRTLPETAASETQILLNTVVAEITILVKDDISYPASESQLEFSQTLIDTCTELLASLDLPHDAEDVKTFINDLVLAKKQQLEQQVIWGVRSFYDSEGQHETKFRQTLANLRSWSEDLSEDINVNVGKLALLFTTS